jgi:transcriptional regulator with PAS, ATPase and Fis domain
MNKILLSWIGKTDVRVARGEEGANLGPIGAAVAKRPFDGIHLVSNLSRVENNDFLKWLRSQTAVPITLHTVSLSSPTVFGEIYQQAIKTIEKIGVQYKETIDFTFHLSPGTPAMASVWIILAKTRFPAELIESSKEGGVRTVSLPFEISAEFIPDLLRRPDQELERLTAGLSPESAAFSNILHRSKSMKQVLALAQRVAIRTVPVLIEGESGTGKELLARAIHHESPRREKPFIAVNCGAIPAELIESELFGHVKNAFTGAMQPRDGHFLSAQGGTIFLDEIGELPLPAQVKLLRVLQEQEVTPVGASKARKIDVRVISATNRTLISEVAEGRFREDLFYRLAVFILRLPPLREREGDVGLLIDALLEKLNLQSASELGLEHKKLSPNAKNLLLQHRWPGNVRELSNTLLRAAVLSTGAKITEEDVQAAIFAAMQKQSESILNRPLGQGFDLPQVISDVARHYLQRAMTEAHGNKSEAAKLVGLPSYQTLTNWLRKYDLDSGT